METFAHAVRGHWGVENQLHWSLDVSFSEDDSRARENLALIRRVALTRLQHDDSKLGIHSKRLKAGWDDRYLAKLLFETPKISPQKTASKDSNIRKT